MLEGVWYTAPDGCAKGELDGGEEIDRGAREEEESDAPAS